MDFNDIKVDYGGFHHAQSIYDTYILHYKREVTVPHNCLMMISPFNLQCTKSVWCVHVQRSH